MWICVFTKNLEVVPILISCNGAAKKVFILKFLARKSAEFYWSNDVIPIILIILLWNNVTPLYAFIITLKEKFWTNERNFIFITISNIFLSINGVEIRNCDAWLNLHNRTNQGYLVQKTHFGILGSFFSNQYMDLNKHKILRFDCTVLVLSMLICINEYLSTYFISL